MQDTKIPSVITEALKDIPASYWGNMAIPEKVEDLEAFVEEVKTDYATITQDLGKASKKEAVSPEIKAFVDKQTEVNKRT